jgi:hypothetical protein
MIEKKWKGPLVTLSGTQDEAGQGLLMAEQLLLSGQCSVVTLLYVDSKVSSLEDFTNHSQVIWNTASARVLKCKTV